VLLLGSLGLREWRVEGTPEVKVRRWYEEDRLEREANEWRHHGQRWTDDSISRTYVCFIFIYSLLLLTSEIQCYTRPPYPPTPSRYIRLGGKDFNNGLVNHIMIPALAVFLGIDGNGILNIFPSDKTADKLNVYVYWGEGLLHDALKPRL